MVVVGRAVAVTDAIVVVVVVVIKNIEHLKYQRSAHREVSR